MHVRAFFRHSLFLKMTQNSEKVTVKDQEKSTEVTKSLLRPFTDAKDLPVFRDAAFLVFE
jgi:hypothetical protein